MPNFRSVSFFCLARRRDTITQINKYTHIQVKLRISSIGLSPHLDFDIHHILGEEMLSSSSEDSDSNDEKEGKNCLYISWIL